MRKDIRVSFKDNEEEDRLYDDIITECKLVGKSAWMKIAAREKLERDYGGKSDSKVQKKGMGNQGGFLGSINSFDDLMP